MGIHNNTKVVPRLPDTEQKLADIFKSLDVDGDGVLCQRELKIAFNKWGAWFPGMPTYRANRGISVADANGDGRVDKAEFGDLVNYALSRGYKVN
ncbi:hypothetical protein Q3G72_026190 [Acer saccharum]|nr:hypothetical protein Q3G72_026190 [Acer saccharum]